ncbi:hypothetical protein LWE61_14600 [Sphingobium sufflavum]|uniref:hypothetical protein n=1 Tax=Sphingobium sufflavum TaxID=1129547 RepID=UPI001F224BA1|nr:hypothetical protein [Sphingobium sufflavum]MCE7797778.1 hypothetical protein [Sphingobium sufflavum]
MSKAQFLSRTGIWLVFLIAGLSLPFLYLRNPPIPFGMAQLRVAGWGAVIGIGSSLAVMLLYWPILGQRKSGERIAGILSALSLGIFGGASGAALLNEGHVVNAFAVELPIVKIKQLRSSRRGDAVQIATLAPVLPTYQVNIPASLIRGKEVREGDCLTGIVQQGRLGGLWAQSFTAHPCSQKRGLPASHVMTIDQGFALWRWHAPRNDKRTGQQQVTDSAIPVDFACLTREGSWLYRCTNRATTPPVRDGAARN